MRQSQPTYFTHRRNKSLTLRIGSFMGTYSSINKDSHQLQEKNLKRIRLYQSGQERTNGRNSTLQE